jgi:hypothetical protein
MNVTQLKLFLNKVFASPDGKLAMTDTVIPGNTVFFVVVNEDNDHIATLNVRQVYWLLYNIENEPASFWKNPVWPVKESVTEYELDQHMEDIYFHNFLARLKQPE